MFDIGFWELSLIAIIGMIVLGPERLPVAIRTVRGWISGVRKFSDSVKTELTEELRIQELHANLKKAEQADMKNLSPEIAESLKTLQEAAEMVNRPYQLDKEPEKVDSQSIVSENIEKNDKVTEEAAVTANLSSSQENKK
ncbi:MULTISPECIES: Sec-independent protein translocase protein TatB [unclassified Colwellia]|jgi:sec-independent protein translocase protein TatB|uniref:Sec-independent protein translocase protein TatB n=1 Tax=unclassified Colwellia TaxID=196834 RepID=UPI0015F6E5C6|nr:MULTISPECIES: Sec-independent protein translocase protein TatB [unclassified Colwellia]MBA6362208.1 Sec-independent protein translocase subunit TatB [Colwellia sp. BRX8-8]MBA6338241.1 Sec-independent protein translocase subunit TatB [Colwellia sp. BRX8-7]MBA6357043.1 Sec-independent protein translocase subunit TatB [Colwellia sp. BRX8-3]MBA6360648.1 Sec-independent protein translocase subunit TatB [Colwellia sp. BRX8-6]MBA6368998.1 Sec-independent protein translocase subunit TatB [Colwellia